MFQFLKRSRRHTEAEAAIADADKQLERIKQRNTEVDEIAKTLRIIRERNHFAEQISDIMKERHA